MGTTRLGRSTLTRGRTCDLNEDGSPREGRVRRRGDRGTGMVELAFAVPLFVSMMLGTITSGLALNDDLQLAHAAREGARYGATVPDAESFTSGTWATNVRQVVLEQFGDELTVDSVCIALVTGSPAIPVSADHTTNIDGTACYDDSGSGVTNARVQVTAAKQASIDAAFFRHDVLLTSQATAQHESNG